MFRETEGRESCPQASMGRPRETMKRPKTLNAAMCEETAKLNAAPKAKA